MFYFKYNVSPSERVGMHGVFLGLAGLLLGISLRLCFRDIPRSSPASPWKTLSIPPLLLGLTHSGYKMHAKLCQYTEVVEGGDCVLAYMAH